MYVCMYVCMKIFWITLGNTFRPTPTTYTDMDTQILKIHPIWVTLEPQFSYPLPAALKIMPAHSLISWTWKGLQLYPKIPSKLMTIWSID